ncbi:MAG TPA: LytR C-terminal domain-containing protein, partial [Gammaproteobacteria bacterium]|nr:LytR C-terminal domain-containing protein [Gammaproteobacteria bacterium]
AVQVLTTASRKEGANPRVRRNLVQAQEHLFAELDRKDRNTPEPAQPQKTALAREPEQRPRQAPPSVEPEVPEYDVEIANGNGRNGMAYLTSRYLEQEGVRVAEISNAAHFGYEETAVYYAPGYEAAARQVASLLRLPVALEELPAARLPAKVRVVLGEDFMVYDRALRTAALADTDAGAAGDPGASDTGVLTAAVEVSNGNGRTGMAALVGRALRADGRVVGRLTNADSFSIRRTTVYYRPGGRKEAERVAGSLPVEAAVEESGAMRRDIGVRVVIGRDILDHETEIRNQTSVHA